MTDRELLELAAKAVGINTDECPVFDYGVDWGEKAGIWNPLTDDGDALRLAVRLHMEVYHADDDGMACYAAWPNARGYAYAIEQHDDDPCAATRRAIVRAAAEIGRQMPCQN